MHKSTVLYLIYNIYTRMRARNCLSQTLVWTSTKNTNKKIMAIEHSIAIRIYVNK